MSILITRLLTGEEILGDVESINETSCKISNPTHIEAAHNPKTSNIDVHMAPFAPLCLEKHIVVNLSVVVCQYAPVVEVLNKYNALFGSRLIVPTAGGITAP